LLVGSPLGVGGGICRGCPGRAWGSGGWIRFSPVRGVGDSVAEGGCLLWVPGLRLKDGSWFLRVLGDTFFLGG
jgi:hypothetical protein